MSWNETFYNKNFFICFKFSQIVGEICQIRWKTAAARSKLTKTGTFSCGKLRFCAPWPWRWPSNGNLPWKPHLSQWKLLKLSVKFFFWAEKTISLTKNSPYENPVQVQASKTGKCDRISPHKPHLAALNIFQYTLKLLIAAEESLILPCYVGFWHRQWVKCYIWAPWPDEGEKGW